MQQTECGWGERKNGFLCGHVDADDKLARPRLFVGVWYYSVNGYAPETWKSGRETTTPVGCNATDDIMDVCPRVIYLGDIC
jgi:hypothetical protein